MTYFKRKYRAFPDITTIFAIDFYKNKMIVYNTTFHIEKDILDESLDYLKNSISRKPWRAVSYSGHACDV